MAHSWSPINIPLMKNSISETVQGINVRMSLENINIYNYSALR